MAFLAAAVPFASQFMPQFNGTQPNIVWEQKARDAMQPELERRLHHEHAEIVSIKTPLGGNEGAFAKKQVTFNIDRFDLKEGPGKEQVIVPCTQQDANGPITCGDKRSIMFTEMSYGTERLPAILNKCGFDAINKDGSLKKECPPAPSYG